MKRFRGFPARMAFTSIPNPFFSEILPHIEDMAELKTVLHVMAALYRKKGYPRLVTFRELLGDVSLMQSLGGRAESPEDLLRQSLEKAKEREVLQHLTLEKDGGSEDIYLLNDEAGRQAAAKMRSGEVSAGKQEAVAPVHVEAAEPPDIFALYEENIGMLTPMIADELKEAEKTYPPEWLRDAVREAVHQNKRNWRYISAILQRWATEGKRDGAYQRDSEKDPDKYVKGKYGHMVRR